jgi:lipopolysaccharide export system permease protein
VISTLDRMFLLSFARSYLIVWTSLVSLYVVIDLFTNIDDFGQKGGGLQSVVNHITEYYSYRVIQIFDLMAEAITLMAAMFSVAWLQRNNELLPQLSAGIPTRRVIRPILLGAAITLALGPLNQELVIPRVADELMKPRDDPDGTKAQAMMGAFDANAVHLEGTVGTRKDQSVMWMYVTIPENAPCGLVHLVAREAKYIPPGSEPQSGGWLLTYTVPETIDPALLPPYLVQVHPTVYFLKTEADFEGVSRGATWFLFASTPRLRELLERPEPRRQAKIAVEFHRRITRPLVGAIIVLLGLSVILRNPNRHVFISVGLCLSICALFYACVLGCKFLGTNDYVSPPLSAWLPVLVFGPLTLVSFDAMHT